MNVSCRTYITEVDLLTRAGRVIRYTGQCKAQQPDPDVMIDGAIIAALSYHPDAEILESRVRTA